MLLQLKRLGKKKVLETAIALDGPLDTGRDLITACVRHEVARYNARQRGEDVLPYLLPADIQAQIHTGRISVGEVAEGREASMAEAVEAALLAHEDRLFVMFVNDVEVRDLDAPLAVTEASVVVFVRLTFLAGGMY